MTVTTREVRKPLSLRIPPGELDAVKEFAVSHRLSTTDAFLHFLRKGLEAEASGKTPFMEIQESLNKILVLVGNAPSNLTQEEIILVVEQAVSGFPAIGKVYLFGSFARGDATASSDIDIQLELSDTVAFSLFDLARLKESIERRTGREVDIVTAKKLKNPNLQKAIESERIPIYERKEQ